VKLSQEEYVDNNGRKVPASKADQVATYYYVMDGFYTWYCPCGEEHSTRSCGWPIAGQVLRCPKCGKHSLLLRSDTDFVNRGAKFAVEFDGEKSVIDKYKKRAEQAEEYEQELRRSTNELLNSLECDMRNGLTGKFGKLKKRLRKRR
jgi:hypothetical protein